MASSIVELKAKKWSMVACDMDGTLLREDHTLSEHTVNTLRKLVTEKNVKLCLASGRMVPRILAYEEQIGVDFYVVGLQGTRAHDLRANGRTLLVNHTVPMDVNNDLIRVCQERGLYLNVYLGDDLYGTDEPALQRHPDLYERDTGAVYKKVKSLDQFILTEDSPVEAYSGKLLIVVDTEDRQRVYEEMKALFGKRATVVATSNNFIEFLHPECNKNYGLQGLLQKLEIPSEEVVFFGDHNNDIEALEACGLGICVGNGVEKAKRASKRISEWTNDEDSVARELELLFDL